MGIYKRGEVYWYKFTWQGRSVRESTKQGNDKVARQMEAAHKTSLARGEVGIREKRPVPTLREFCDTRVEPWAKASFEYTCVNNWFWFRAGIRRLRGCESLAKTRLDEITNETVAGFARMSNHDCRIVEKARLKTSADWPSAPSTVQSACSAEF